MVKYKNILIAIKQYIEKCLDFNITVTYVNSQGKETIMKVAKMKMPYYFSRRLEKARNSQPQDKRWRVDVYDGVEGNLIPEDNWIDCDMYVTENGSTFAVKKEGEKKGDIISVCDNRKSKNKDNMAGLMQFAVSECGGTKLDSFHGNYGFYRYCGFEPVSWIDFNTEFKPVGWDEKFNDKEPIVFMKYTGNVRKMDEKQANEELSLFYESVPKTTGDDAYDDAMRIRDENM